MSDRPHIITVALSVIAVAVSLCSACFSFCFGVVGIYLSFKALTLNESTSRAVVQPVSLAITSDWKWNQSPGAVQQPIKVEMTVSNSGKLLASGFKVEFWPSLCNSVPQADNGSGDYPSAQCSTNVGRVINEDDLGPGVFRTYKVDLGVNPEPVQKVDLSYLGQVNTIRLQPNFYYKDENGEHHEQPCFQAYALDNGTFAAGPVYPCNLFDRRPVSPR
jgi:hypothetical protein